MVFYRDQIVWGFSLPLNNQQEKNNIETFGLLLMGQCQKQRGQSQLSLPKSDHQKVIWFGSRCRFLCTLIPSDYHPALHPAELPT